jgi:hypothetical protein
MEGLLKNIKLTVLDPYIGSTGTTDTTSIGYVDMQGYDSVCLVGMFTEVIAGGKLGFYPYTGATVATLAATTAYWVGTTISTTAMETQCVAMDLIKPTVRYIGAAQDKATAAGGMTILAIQYNGLKFPVTQSTELYGCINTTSIAGAT